MDVALLPRMLLHKHKLLERFDMFNRGLWELSAAGGVCCTQAAVCRREEHLWQGGAGGGVGPFGRIVFCSTGLGGCSWPEAVARRCSVQETQGGACSHPT